MTQPPRPRALPSRRHGATSTGATSLGEAFGSARGWPGAARLQELPIDTIRPNPQQPRKRFQEDALAALAAPISKRGVLQPVLVRPLADSEPAYELIAGERRWRAARMAGLDRLPAFIREDTDDASALELALIENAARQDLTPVEEARTLSTLINDLGVTQGALADGSAAAAQTWPTRSGCSTSPMTSLTCSTAASSPGATARASCASRPSKDDERSRRRRGTAAGRSAS